MGCEVGLPRGEFNRAEISADGKTFAPIACRADGGRLTIKLAERDLADGVIILRLVKE